MSNPRRILIMVPNGASGDNRVVREAESLKQAGHEVLLSGLRLPNLSGLNAITPHGVPVRRVDWQYRAYSRIAIVYAVVLLPLLALLAVAVAVAAWYVYNGFLAPLAASMIDALASAGLWLTNWIRSVIFQAQSPLSVPDLSLEGLRGHSPLAYHAGLLLFLAVVAFLLRPVFRRVLRGFSASRKQLLENPALVSLRRKALHARNYGERENVRNYTLIEMILAPDSSRRGRLHEKLTQYFIMKSRTLAFVELGREFRPDIVQCHEIGTLPAAIALKEELGCKVIYEAHEIYDDLASASAQQSKTYRNIHESCLSKVDGFITVNEDIGEYYRTTYANLPMPVIMPNSVYPKQVTYDGRLHEAAGLPTEAKIVLYQGGFSPNRGLPILLEAAFNFPEGWNVVFMGKGPLEEELKTRAEDMQNFLLDKARRKLSLSVLAEMENAESLSVSSFTQATENQEQVMQRILVEELVLGQSLSGGKEAEFNSSAVENAVKNVRNTEVRLAVDRKLRRRLDEIRASGALNRARFVPMAPHSELVEWTAGAAVGVIPYENIGLNHWFCSPNKIWEYPNAGVPILASRLHYLTHMINKWDIGWTFASDPTVAEIVSIIRSISDADIARKKESCAKFITADNYTIHEQRLFGLISSL